MSIDRLDDLRQRKEKIRRGGDPKAIEKLRSKGKLTARERIEQFFDPGSFVELGMFVKHRITQYGMDKREIPAEGVITGYGKVDGRTVFAFAQDFTAFGGTFGEMHGLKICELMDRAVDVGAPVVGLSHSGGARLNEVLLSQDAFGYMFYRNSIYSGVIPQISAIMGSVGGGQSYSPGLTDFIIMTKDSYMYIAGPAFVETNIGEKATEAELGGTSMHSRVSGVCHVVADDDEDCLLKIRELLSYLPSSNREKPPFVDTGDDPNRKDEELNNILPPQTNQPYDMKNILSRIVDNGRLFEIHAGWAQNMIVGFARLGGYSVGIVANQPLVSAGSINVWASEKASRFVRFCDAFNIPVIYFQDTPGYLIGTQQERLGMIYRGATLLYATSEATVPKITVVIRKAHAGAFISMGSKMLGTDQVYAWPTAEISGGSAATFGSIIFRREIAAAENPEEKRQQLVKEFSDKYYNPYRSAEIYHTDDVIEPWETRPRLVSALEMLKDKKRELPWKKHSNNPY